MRVLWSGCDIVIKVLGCLVKDTQIRGDRFVRRSMVSCVVAGDLSSIVIIIIIVVAIYIIIIF